MKKKHSNIIIYQAKNGGIELRGDIQKDTLWATQAQIAKIFGTERSVVTKHIGNILKTKELDKNSVCANFAHTAEDGKSYLVQYYNLDIILAVGYRANSARAIQFRQWATKILRQYITKGYTINPKMIRHHYAEFQKAIENIRNLVPFGNSNIKHGNVLDLISAFADTWFSLDAYDKDTLIQKGSTKKNVTLTSEQLTDGLSELKTSLIAKQEATDIFGQEREKNAVSGIVGNVMQSFSGKPLYASVEEKAAHLLYFMIKNHPFVDGNKRSAAFAFVWLLDKAKILNQERITSAALTALTLFIAESDPKNKPRMIALVLQLLKT